jgi:ABC-type molybdate transport system substrate-binding protein
VSKLPAQECSAKKQSNPRSLDSLFVYKSPTISGTKVKHYNTVTSNSLMTATVAPEYASNEQHATNFLSKFLQERGVKRFPTQCH